MTLNFSSRRLLTSSLTQSEGKRLQFEHKLESSVKFILDWTYVIGNIVFLDYYFCRISLGLHQNWNIYDIPKYIILDFKIFGVWKLLSGIIFYMKHIWFWVVFIKRISTIYQLFHLDMICSFKLCFWKVHMFKGYNKVSHKVGS